MRVFKDILFYAIALIILILIIIYFKLIITVIVRSYVFLIMAFFGSFFIYELIKAPFYLIKDLPNMVNEMKTNTLMDWATGVIALFWTVGTIVGIVYFIFRFFSSTVANWF